MSDSRVRLSPVGSGSLENPGRLQMTLLRRVEQERAWPDTLTELVGPECPGPGVGPAACQQVLQAEVRTSCCTQPVVSAARVP